MYSKGLITLGFGFNFLDWSSQSPPQMFKLLEKIPKYWTGSGYHDGNADEDSFFLYCDDDDYYGGDDEDDNDNYRNDDDVDDDIDNEDDVDDTQGAGAADCKPARHN